MEASRLRGCDLAATSVVLAAGRERPSARAPQFSRASSTPVRAARCSMPPGAAVVAGERGDRRRAGRDLLARQSRSASTRWPRRRCCRCTRMFARLAMISVADVALLADASPHQAEQTDYLDARSASVAAAHDARDCGGAALVALTCPPSSRLAWVGAARVVRHALADQHHRAPDLATGRAWSSCATGRPARSSARWCWSARA